MTSSPEPLDFDSLRRSAIEYAQAASGNIWTDFNLHDPGVTLLEQTCFALTEVSFQATHSTSDLLTDAEGVIRFGPLSLFLPAETLPGDPVTLLDLAAELSEVTGIARVLVSRGPRAGLLNAVIIPAQAEPGDAGTTREALAKDAVRQAFAARRPLGCDLHRLDVARRAPARLAGHVQITGTAIPERVAAEIYYHISAILRGQSVGHHATIGATRQIVFDQPQTYLHAPSEQDGKVPDLEDHLATFREIPGVMDISTLSLTREALTTADENDPADVFYLDLTIPEILTEIELELTLNGVALTLDPSLILEEFVRVSADHIAQAQHHLDAADWIPPPSGQHRNFDMAPVDALLPNAYETGVASSPEAGLMRRYRAAINAQLSDMSATLEELPHFLVATTDQGSNDPKVLRQRLAVLDFLIAHQGEEMPETLHAGLHVYRSAAERAHFDIAWRLDFLEALPFLNRARGTGPDGQSPGGFLSKFRLLADLNTGGAGRLAQISERFLLVSETADADAAPEFSRSDLRLPDNPFEMLICYNPLAESLTHEALLAASPWIKGGVLGLDEFRRAAVPSAFLVSQVKDGGFGVFFDTGHAKHLHCCAEFETHSEASDFTQRIRASWKELHSNAEGVYLVEDILLRNSGTDYAPNTASLVLTGWTARTSQPTYRAYVERLIDRLSPAHMLIEPKWLDQNEMLQFEKLRAGSLDGDADAKRDLRNLLAQRMAAK